MCRKLTDGDRDEKSLSEPGELGVLDGHRALDALATALFVRP
jgi:hypothetical protein